MPPTPKAPRADVLTPVWNEEDLQRERVRIAARILASWRPACQAGDEESWRPDVPLASNEEVPSAADYRRTVCKQALAWADSLIAASRRGDA